ncbi:MAG: DUF349 domain-containing protein, partial [Prevotella sp.]|nr:DUF349 domain-containing protein [Prevotella sp.]
EEQNAVENQQVEETTVVEATTAEEAQEQKIYADKAEVLARMKEIAESEDAPDRDEVSLLQALYYKMQRAEREASMKEFVDGGGEPEAYQMPVDETEDDFKAALSVIKERRQKLFLEQKEEEQRNLQKKLDILEKIKAMSTSPEEANKSYKDFKALQEEWREIQNVPAENATELWRNYQLYVEQFYDLLKLNHEAREYDFKKNLEIKTRLCEAAEKLASEEDVVSAFHQLQNLHQEYRETGPVAKELRDEIWNRFKAASTVINKAHQAHFEAIRAREEENLAKKTALCEKVEAINGEENNGSADWEAHSKQIIELQAEWKTIGFAPQKMNVKIFERFRSACDAFFTAKAEYYKNLKETYAKNAEKKREIIERAKALMDSTEWRSTGDKLIALQKEWKTVGSLPKKLGDQLWEEFQGACQHFFEKRNAQTAGQRNEQQENLEKKRGVIARLEALLSEGVDDLQAEMKKLQEEYNAIGHVPFREKDNIYNAYHAAVDAIYKQLKSTNARRHLNNFRNRIKDAAAQGAQTLENERARLVRQLENLTSEIKTYENNICFLTASSKKGNSLVDEMNRKLEQLKNDLQIVKEKIKTIDQEK